LELAAASSNGTSRTHSRSPSRTFEDAVAGHRDEIADGVLDRRFDDALWLVAVSGIRRAFSDASPNAQTILERHIEDALSGVDARIIGVRFPDAALEPQSVLDRRLSDGLSVAHRRGSRRALPDARLPTHGSILHRHR
jgi:hypothetical protein